LNLDGQLGALALLGSAALLGPGGGGLSGGGGLQVGGQQGGQLLLVAQLVGGEGGAGDNMVLEDLQQGEGKLVTEYLVGEQEARAGRERE
jgi:hypothetical protein